MTRIFSLPNLAKNKWIGIEILAMTTLIMFIGCGPTYPKCDDDNDCHEGEFCVNGTCQQCRDDTDCATGQQCMAGRCEPIEGYCTTSDDCGPDQECVSNRCQAKPQAQAPTPEPPPRPCQIESVYFDFDSSNIRSNASSQLSGNAECLREKGATDLKLTGHCDPRGTEEYNLALGDRRAKAVSDYLKSLGVTAKINHMSMGEEMAQGTDESSWARDRRVDFQVNAASN